MKIEFQPFENRIWLSSPTMHGPELEYVTEAYRTNWMSTVGENINKAERLACEKIGCEYAVGLSAGTAALHMAVKLAGVKPGDKVFCSDLTFDATVNPVVYEGGVPIFIDTEYDTWNMDPAVLEKAFELYPDVKVVVIAHLYGTPGKMEALKEICDIPVVLFDERCTTMVAHNILNFTDTRGTKRKAVIDNLSAEIILQNYLDSQQRKH